MNLKFVNENPFDLLKICQAVTELQITMSILLDGGALRNCD